MKTLKELYEARENIRAMKSEKQKELDELKEKTKAATDEQLGELETKAKGLADDISALKTQEEDVESEIADEEKKLKDFAETSRRSNEIRKTEVSADYLKTKAAMDDFANVLLKAGNDRAQMKKLWRDNLAEKGISNAEILFPEPVVNAITDAFDNAGGIFATFKKLYGFTSYSTAMNGNEGDSGEAHTHTLTSGYKQEQDIYLIPKEIRCDFVYKYLTIPKKILKETQSTGAVIKYVLAEMPQRVVRAIERAAILGDAQSSFPSIEAIAASSNVPTYCADINAGNIYDALVDGVAAVSAEGAVYMVTSKTTIAEMRKARDDNGALLFPMGLDIAGALGVSQIFTPDWYDPTNLGYQAIIYVGNAYVFIGDETIENHENFILRENKNEYLAELYCGGALMEAKSAAKVSVVPSA
jgi:HK97 family phage major capsid protein